MCIENRRLLHCVWTRSKQTLLERFSLVSLAVFNLRSDVSVVESVGKDKKMMIRFDLHTFQGRNKKQQPCQPVQVPGHEQACEEGFRKEQDHS